MTNILFLQFLLPYEDSKTHLRICFLQVQPKKKGSGDEDLGLLDPDRIRGKQYELVHRSDTKLCPKSVQRCEQCRVAFHQGDIVSEDGGCSRAHRQDGQDCEVHRKCLSALSVNMP